MPLCTINHNHPSFKRGTKEAARRHRGFLDALTKVLKAIEADPMVVGDQIDCADVEKHVRKVRIGSPKDNLSPSGGYRLIFQVISDGTKMTVRLLDVFYKPNQATIKRDAVKRLIDIAPAIDLAAEAKDAEAEAGQVAETDNPI